VSGAQELLNWSLLVGVLGFLLRQAYTDWLAARRRRKERHKFLLALAAEIRLNNDELRFFEQKFPQGAVLLQFLKEGSPDAAQKVAATSGDRPISRREDDVHAKNDAIKKAVCYRPLIVHYYLDFIFKSNVGLITSMPDPVIKSIIQYYGKLETVTELSEAMSSSSFEDISVGSRFELLSSIKSHLTQAREIGDSILAQVELLIHGTRGA